MYRNTILPQLTSAMPPTRPPPSHRHGAPSGPWPFIDIDDDVAIGYRITEPLPSAARPCRHTKRSSQEICWCRYPQSLFPNWTPRQQKKSRITKILERRGESSLHYLDILQDGAFMNVGAKVVNPATQHLHWADIQHVRSTGVKTRAIFVENLTGPVLQMLGTRYNIEPFFFSSSIGWIPSRFQSNIVPNQEDHITITLVFIRPIPNPTTAPPSPTSNLAASTASVIAHTDLIIDTQSPLLLRSCSSFSDFSFNVDCSTNCQKADLILFTELMALHVVRSPDLSTIISYHPAAEHRATLASSMHARMHSMGHSVYWSRILRDEKDPTLVVLSLLWYAIYAWDEALEALYAHICRLESRVLAKNDIYLTQELHLIRAHLLHYESLLRDFQRTISFVQGTPFPSLQNSEMYTEEERLRSEEVMRRECGNLSNELQRLDNSRVKYALKVKNVMDMAFSMVNIKDSRRMKQLTKAAVQDGAAMKQISHLTMVFFPASFVATVFGMNVTTLNEGSLATLGLYFAMAVPLTVLTIWIMVALKIDIKQVKIHRMRRRNRTDVVPGTKERSKPSQDTIRKTHVHGKGSVIEGHKPDTDEEESEMDRVEFRYNYKNRAMGEGETEMVLDIWARLCWPLILFSTALDERRRRQRRSRTGKAGSNNNIQ